MTAQTFSFEDLFSASIPSEPEGRGAHPRSRYDFGVAYPDPDSLPLAELAEALRVGLEEEGRDLALYPHPQGYPPLREYLAEKLARNRKLSVAAEDIMLGEGSSQPNHMIIEALVDPGDVVLTEDFTYPGTLRFLRRFQADIRGVACDSEGMLPDALEAVLGRALSEGRRVKLIYTIPTFQNPQGWVMSLERRKAVLELALRHRIPILEDDCYVDLRFEGEPVDSIASLNPEAVIYVGSFSKIIGPGMRLGYLAGPSQLLDRITAIRSGSGVSQFGALAVHRYALGGLDEHVGKINRILLRKRDAMLAALADSFGSCFGSEASWSRPLGGLFVWLSMPAGTDTARVAESAAKEGILFLPGARLCPEGQSGHNRARLCFGYNRPEEIIEGIARLSEVFQKDAVAAL